MKKYPNLTSAEIIADSISPKGHRMTTIKMVFPRYILAELNTHRMFNRNSASSRAIPFRKMVRSAIDNPFIPMAFQKDHSGMQGTEYIDPELPMNISSFREILKKVFKYSDEDLLNSDERVDEDLAGYVDSLLSNSYDGPIKQTVVEWWIYCRDKAIECAILMSSLGVTKQICNRILETFIYHTALITATEWENFFELRCPKYELNGQFFKDKMSYHKAWCELNNEDTSLPTLTPDEWLLINKGAGEIHIMDLAEKVWDAMNESIPEKLEDGQWHVPFSDRIDREEIRRLRDTKYPDVTTGYLITKIATARAARISYETLGENPKIDYEADIKLHDDLLAMGHMSPFEHIGRVMSDDEYLNHIKTSEANVNYEDTGVHAEADGSIRNMIYLSGTTSIPESDFGWSRNLHGFIQYREIVEQLNK